MFHSKLPPHPLKPPPPETRRQPPLSTASHGAPPLGLHHQIPPPHLAPAPPRGSPSASDSYPFGTMNKLLELGRRALFVIRVVSGYEERRIRSHRLQLQKRIEEAQARKNALKRAPEQFILTEVRRVVKEMQTLNRRLEETEAAIDEYFKPVDKNAETLMNLQLDKEEKNMKQMAEVMQEELHQQRIAAEAQIISGTSESNLNSGHTDQGVAGNSINKQQGT